MLEEEKLDLFVTKALWVTMAVWNVALLQKGASQSRMALCQSPFLFRKALL
jgi:hypothetical protein